MSTLMIIFPSLQVKTRVAGRVHALTIRDVKLSEAAEVKLTSTDFQTLAQLIVNGEDTAGTVDASQAEMTPTRVVSVVIG